MKRFVEDLHEAIQAVANALVEGHQLPDVADPILVLFNHTAHGYMMVVDQVFKQTIGLKPHTIIWYVDETRVWEQPMKSRDIWVRDLVYKLVVCIEGVVFSLLHTSALLD
jgi:hypothetical protein